MVLTLFKEFLYMPQTITKPLDHQPFLELIKIDAGISSYIWEILIQRKHQTVKKGYPIQLRLDKKIPKCIQTDTIV